MKNTKAGVTYSDCAQTVVGEAQRSRGGKKNHPKKKKEERNFPIATLFSFFLPSFRLVIQKQFDSNGYSSHDFAV
jgi:hypothetical protein